MKYAKHVGKDGGIDYRVLAAAMTVLGYSMSHSTARYVAAAAIEKIIRSMSDDEGLKLSSLDIEKIATDPLFLDALGEVIRKSEPAN